MLTAVTTSFLQTQDEDVARGVLIGNQKGGTAKTTLAVNVAMEAVRLGARVLVVDTDPNVSATEGLFGMQLNDADDNTVAGLISERPEAGGAADYLLNAPDNWQPRQDLPWEAGGVLPGSQGVLAVLPGSHNYGITVESNSSKPANESWLKRALTGVSRQFDLVIFDSQGDAGRKVWLPVHAAGTALAANPPSSMTNKGLDNNLSFIRTLTEAFDLPLRFAGAVPTRCLPGTVDFREGLAQMSDIVADYADTWGEWSGTVPGGKAPFTAGCTVWPERVPERAKVLKLAHEHQPLSHGLTSNVAVERSKTLDVLLPHTRVALKLLALTEAPALPDILKNLRKNPIDGLWPGQNEGDAR